MSFKYLYLLPIALSGCASTMTESTALSVCDVTSNSDHYIGRKLAIHASYSSDHRHGEIFWDKACPGKVITGGYEVKNRDPSVDAFYESDSKNCKHPLACPAKAEVTVVGILKRDEDGLYINISKFLHADIIE